jgi:Membrane proteins related to metalloendopeptidases
MYKSIAHIIFFLACILIPSSRVLAQKGKPTSVNQSSKEQLQSQRQAILDEIKQAQNELNLLQQDKKTSLAQLQAVQAKLNARQKLIQNINAEIKRIDDNIQLANQDVIRYHQQLSVLKKQYAEMVRYTYKNKTSYDMIVFLFSANTFNDAIRRMRYVKQYRGYRADQAVKILSASKQLTNKITVLNDEKKKKDFVLQVQQQQNKILEDETLQKNKIVNELKSKEKELLAQLATKKKKADELNRAIAAAIQKEIEIARKRAIEERIQQEKLRKAKEEQERKLAKEKALAAEKARKEQEAQRIAKEKKEREEAEQKLALAKKMQEEKEQQAQIEKQKREEQERKLQIEKKEREEAERKLAIEKKEREEAERKASKLAEEQRIEREKQLAIEKEKQEERQRLLAAEKKRQEEEQRRLADQRREQEAEQKRLAILKQKQEDEQRQLLAIRQRQEEENRRKEEERKQQEREKNKSQAPFGNPRYVAEVAEKLKYGDIALNTGSSESGSSNRKPINNESTNAVNNSSELKSNTKTFEKDDYKFSLTPSERELANNFEASKGRLPWPVEKGFITERFGKNKHPIFNVTTENNGIDIRTSRGSKARAVFAGEVASIISIPGVGGQTVLINHGSYYTVYANLDKVLVSKGSKVTMKQPVGIVLTDDDGNTTMNFQVWKVGIGGAVSKVNPEFWIAQ